MGPLFKLLEASFELIVPLVVASMIDVGIANSDRGYILKMCLIMAALGLIGLTCSVTAQFFAAKAAVGFATKLRHGLFEHIQKLSFPSNSSCYHYFVTNSTLPRKSHTNNLPKCINSATQNCTLTIYY